MLQPAKMQTGGNEPAKLNEQTAATTASNGKQPTRSKRSLLATSILLLKLTSVIGLSLLVLIDSACSAADGAEPELEIHETFKPEPCERKAKSTDVLTLHYKGYLKDSEKVFDSSYERNEPFTFQLGIGQVILGWEKGLGGACVGEKRRLVIPPKLGYGDAKHDQIPPSSTLVFDVEILKIEEGPAPMNVFKEIDQDQDQRLSRKEVGEFLRKQLSQANQHGDTGSPDDPDRMQMIDEIFMHEDKDKDDYITHDEFSGPKYDHDEL